VQRNHLGIDSSSLHQHCLTGTKYTIRRYQAKIIEALAHINEAPDLTTVRGIKFMHRAWTGRDNTPALSLVNRPRRRRSSASAGDRSGGRPCA
jgi:hypothetical protein